MRPLFRLVYHCLRLERDTSSSQPIEHVSDFRSPLPEHTLYGVPGWPPSTMARYARTGIAHVVQIRATLRDCRPRSWGRQTPLLNQRNLPCKTRSRVRTDPVGGTDVIERSRQKNLMPIFVDAAAAQHLLRSLLEGVQSCQPDRVIFFQPLLRLPIDER